MVDLFDNYVFLNIDLKSLLTVKNFAFLNYQRRSQPQIVFQLEVTFFDRSNSILVITSHPPIVLLSRRFLSFFLDSSILDSCNRYNSLITRQPSLLLLCTKVSEFYNTQYFTKIRRHSNFAIKRILPRLQQLTALKDFQVLLTQGYVGYGISDMASSLVNTCFMCTYARSYRWHIEWCMSMHLLPWAAFFVMIEVEILPCQIEPVMLR